MRLDNVSDIGALRNRNAMVLSGRGWSVPPRFTDGGGLDWNCPPLPTDQEVIHAANLAIGEVVGTAYGSEILDRGHGTTIELVLQSLPSRRHIIDRFEALCSQAISSHCPFINVVSVASSYIISIGRLIMKIVWQFAEAISDELPATTTLAIGSAGLVEVLDG